MKKLTTLFILVFLSVGLFAEPKIPKYYFDDSDKKEDAYTYISNDFKYCYEIQAHTTDTPNFKYKINFQKRSLEYDSKIALLIYFKTEKQLDNFINNFHIANIENEFNKIRQQIIILDGVPNPTQKNFKDEYFDFEHRPQYIFYQIDGSRL